MLAMHGVGDDSWGMMPSAVFTAHKDELQVKVDSNALWVAPAGEIIRYVTERNNYGTTVTRLDTDRIQISFTGDPLGGKVYDELLTLVADIYHSQGSLSITQNGTTHSYSIVSNGRIKFDTDPAMGDIILNASGYDADSPAQASTNLIVQ